VIIQINQREISTKSQKLRTTANGKFNDIGSDILEMKLNSPIC